MPSPLFSTSLDALKEIYETQLEDEFSPDLQEKIAKYVYVLQDPRNNEIFYVGQGTGLRVFQHFNRAWEFFQNPDKSFEEARKLFRIIDIWTEALKVNVYIMARDLSQETGDPVDVNIPFASLLESAIYHLAQISGNLLTNKIVPPHSHFIPVEEVKSLLSAKVNPEEQITVFIFNIKSTLEERQSAFESVRKYWSVNSANQSLDAYAVGLVNGVSVTAHKIDHWYTPEDSEKQAFKEDDSLREVAENQLKNQDFTNIIQGLGAWRFGQYLIVEFDGKGSYRVLRGSSDKEFHHCITENE